MPLGGGIKMPQLCEVGLQLIALLLDPGGVVVRVKIAVATVADESDYRSFDPIPGHFREQLHGAVH